MHEKMTDEEWATLQSIASGEDETWDDRWRAWMKKAVAHIAALTAERDGAVRNYDAEVAARVRAEAQRNMSDREAHALRERVTALEAERDTYRRDFEAELSGAASLRKEYGAREGETFFAFVGRLASDSSRLSAIRQRAHVYFAGKAPSPAYVTVESRVAFLMGDAAPEVCAEPSTVQGPHKLGTNSPSEMDGMQGEMAKQTAEEARTELEAAGVDVPALIERCRDTVRRVRSSQPAPTTAEAFSLTLGGIRHAPACTTTPGSPVCGCGAIEARSALSLLERRMGAQDAAIRSFLREWDSGGTLNAVPSIRALRAALTDAPPVLTLEEVDEVMRVVAHQGSAARMDEPLMESMRRSVMERLAALRR